MFTVEDRERVSAHVLALAAADPRVVAGAVVGSLAMGEGDRWSDLDLTFAVSDGVALSDVLDDWTRELSARFDAVQLFDLPAGPSIYRVFILRGCLQFDLSFTPASQFGAIGPRFRLLFGSAVERAWPAPPRADELLGYAVHHALRARVCIERGQLWQAEYWISSVRDSALSLACRSQGLPTSYGRGFDDLPAEVREPFRAALVRSLDRAELRRALDVGIGGLLSEAGEARLLASSVEQRLRTLAADWSPVREPAVPEQATLRTDRLLLRPFVLADAKEVQRLAGDPLVARTTLAVPHPYPDGAAEAWIAAHPMLFQAGAQASFAIERLDDGALIGAIGLRIERPHGRAELGYWIGVPFWSQGYCTEAAHAIIRYGFLELGLHRIYARCLTINPASARVLRKAGMAHEGTRREDIRKDGVFLSSEDYGMLKADFLRMFPVGS